MRITLPKRKASLLRSPQGISTTSCWLKMTCVTIGVWALAARWYLGER